MEIGFSTDTDTENKVNGVYKRPFTLSLPPELLLEILSYLTDSQATLYAVTLVSRQWFQCAIPLLYQCPRIHDTYRWATFILTLTRRKRTLCYGSMVTAIDLSAGSSLDRFKKHEFYDRLSDGRIASPGSDAVPMNQTRVLREPMTMMHAHHPSSMDMVSHNQQDVSTVLKGYPSIVVSTSSLIQLSRSCHTLTSIDLSFSSLLYDSVIEETGEYLSTLQHYAVQPGLTQVQIPIEAAIEVIGKECKQLEEVKMQSCEWVTAYVIWMWVCHCPNLTRLDARKTAKCSVKRLTATVLEVQDSKNESTSDTESRSSRSTQTDRTTMIDLNEDVDEDEEEDTDMRPTRLILDHEHEMRPVYETIPPRFPIQHTTTSRSVFNHRIPAPLSSSNVVWMTLYDENVHRERRPPSPQTLPMTIAPIANSPISTAGNPTATGHQTLREFVYAILKDAKDLGAMDLAWLQD
ncbi:uncharacterized protein BYT42DRAFT_579902 [Radiomyces spectabilis]|uniref:uncharacterized protein n=1 Tax=Radiomyces spectabilis TaxID=64574 RepID=UPI0022201BD7|nr:uncharacterized protein BYT42DRAFT_579902 [Radiomyces spectabilis]KAI8371341.1 hypothetical protein BYT42DRAFT_579902 [Radiomyces spectabilis]